MNIPDRNRVTVEIYGTSYKLVGSSSDYMKKIAQYVDERMNAISKNHSRLDTPKIAVLAAVHMAEEAIQTQEIRNELKMLTGERSELKAEIVQLQADRAKQTENVLKQQEESVLVIKEKEELQAELSRIQAELQEQLANNKSLLEKEILKNQQLMNNQVTQEQKHKQSLLELDKQLVDLRNNNSQLQNKLRTGEKELKGAQDANSQLSDQLKQSLQQEQSAKTEQQSLQNEVTKLHGEMSQIKDRLAKSESARQLAQKSLEESGVTTRKLEGEVNKLLAEVKSWKMLADKKADEIVDLEQMVLEANEQNETLEVGLKSLHDELSVLKEQSEVDINKRQIAENELLHLQQQHEEVQKLYREMAKRDEETKLENLMLLEEKEDNARLLIELQRKIEGADSREADHHQLLETAQQSLKEWEERYEQLERKQSSWMEEERKLQAELDIWQQEIAVTEEQRDKLRGEKDVVSQELHDIGESFELVAHQYRLLQLEHDMQVEQAKQLQEEHAKLSEEYGKLQSEYNEWIELIEQDQA